MFKREDIIAELEKLDWKDAPEPFLNNADLADSPPFLFRGHDVLTPAPKDGGLIHASPHFKVALSLTKFALSHCYKDFPRNMAFFSVFRATPDQRFYPDETLEYVMTGKEPDRGEDLTSLTKLDTAQHFETAIGPSTACLGTYLYRHKGPFGGGARQIARLTNDGTKRLVEMLQANALTDEIREATHLKKGQDALVGPPVKQTSRLEH